MPGPIIRDTTPYWLKPENASVLDSPLVKAVRALATITGMNDPQQAVFGAMNPTPVAIGLVPRQPVANLLERFADPRTPSAMNQAIAHLAERFPRVMSHVSHVLPADLSRAKAVIQGGEELGARLGDMTPVNTAERAAAIRAGLESQNARPMAFIRMDPSVAGKYTHDYVNTLAHEATHVGQAIRQTDRALRSGEDTVGQKYLSLLKEFGYERHPMEVTARAAGDRKLNDFGAINVARTMLKSGQPDDVISKRLEQVIVGSTDASRKRAIRIAKTMAQRAAEEKR